MNAVQFVKEHGIEYAKSIIAACESGFLPKNNNYSDLKQIVEAWELVESHGGLHEAKWDLDNPVIDASNAFDLKQAINLVEQCHES